MPEMHFDVRWPDGTLEACYSPSTIIREFLVAGVAYDLDDFLVRSRAALLQASKRVEARYGMPCSRALGQLDRIEATGRRFAADAKVVVESLKE